jgi:hypothetical protein
MMSPIQIVSQIESLIKETKQLLPQDGESASTTRKLHLNLLLASVFEAWQQDASTIVFP